MVIWAIIPTYNRKTELENCLYSLLKGIVKPHYIVVVDNNSSDDTAYFLNKVESDYPQIVSLKMKKNLGCTGGFAAGMKYALENGADWFWLIDDDCIVDKQALFHLLNSTQKLRNAILGSLVIDPKRKTSLWMRIDFSKRLIPTLSLPWAGFFISKDVINEIGLPNSLLFIRNDDVEYSFRALYFGFPLYIVPDSVVYHPMPEVKKIKIFKTIVQYYKNEPLWKKYYSARNFIAVYIAYIRMLGRTMFSYRLLRFLLNIVYELLCEYDRIPRYKTYKKAIIDGLKLANEISPYKRKDR